MAWSRQFHIYTQTITEVQKTDRKWGERSNGEEPQENNFNFQHTPVFEYHH